MMSVLPPGANGTIKRICFCGKDWASTILGIKTPNIAITKTKRSKRPPLDTYFNALKDFMLLDLMLFYACYLGGI
jgi:hypothetical protein